MALDKETGQDTAEKGAVHEKLKDTRSGAPEPAGVIRWKKHIFCSVKGAGNGEQVEYPIWRQLYRMENGHVAELTNDTEYSSEFPVLTGDGTALVFAAWIRREA